MQLQQDEVLKLAKQAQAYEELCGEHFIYEFAKLVAEHEREACAKDCEDIDSSIDYYDERVELVCAEVIRARGNNES